MGIKRAGWWAAVVIGAALVVATGIVRARDGGGGGAYEAGELVGSTLGALLIPALIAFLIIRFGKVDGYWALPAVIGAAVALNAVVIVAREGGELADRATACEGAALLKAGTLVPGAPYRARALDAAERKQIADEFAIEGASIDATQIVDTRDKAAFVLTAATSNAEAVREVDLFAGFESTGVAVGQTEMGGRPARIANRPSGTTIIASTGCSAVTLLGIEEAPTRDLAAALRLQTNSQGG